MLQFRCSECYVTNYVEEAQAGMSVKCKNCGAVQAVPADAKAASGPVYPMLGIFAGLTIVAGCIAGLFSIGTISEFSGNPLAWSSSAVSAIVLVGLGLTMFCVRSIAIDTWHIRYAPAEPAKSPP